MNLAPATAKLLDTVGLLIFFAIVGSFAVWVIFSFFRGIGRYRAGDIPVSAGHGH
jgi:hypothetical protein